MTEEVDPFEFPDLDDAPIVHLVQKPLDKMNIEEVDALIEASQKLANNAPARRAALSGKKKPTKPSLNFDQFL